MQVTTFYREKYGPELLMDLGKIEDVPYYFNDGKPHAVDFYEIFFLRKASGTLQLDSQIIELKDGIIIYGSPYQRRIWEVDKRQMEGYFLIFANNFLELLYADKLFIFRLQFFHNHQTPLFIEETEESYRYHQHAFAKISAELQDLKSDSEDFIRAFLMLILAGHNRTYCQTYGLSPERSTNTEAFQFKKLVEEKIRSLHKVEEFADLLRISRITLNKTVKAQFGLTASEFIRRRLFTEIQRELLYTSKTVSEIAFELNFSEASSLIRFFSRMQGQSPTEFRATYQSVNHLIK
ncbi:MAG: helix-turn-helix domain-containing protein [Bacteroidota bacterium]